MIRGDLCLRDDELVVYCNQNGHRYDYRKPSQSYPFCGTYNPLPRLPIAKGYWVRFLSEDSVLLRVSKVTAYTFEFDLVYENKSTRKPTELEFKTKSLDLWVTVMAPVVEAKSLICQTRFLPGDLAIQCLSIQVTVLEDRGNIGYWVEGKHGKFHIVNIQHKPLEVGDWARHIPNGEGSVLRRITYIGNGKMDTDKMLHTGGIRKSICKGYSIKAWVAVKSPLEAKSLEAKSLEAKSLEAKSPEASCLIRVEWDNVTYQGSLAYLRGDILVYQYNNYWGVKHPNTHIRMNGYKTATLAMEDVEQWLK